MSSCTEIEEKDETDVQTTSNHFKVFWEKNDFNPFVKIPNTDDLLNYQWYYLEYKTNITTKEITTVPISLSDSIEFVTSKQTHYGYVTNHYFTNTLMTNTNRETNTSDSETNYFTNFYQSDSFGADWR